MFFIVIEQIDMYSQSTPKKSILGFEITPLIQNPGIHPSMIRFRARARAKGQIYSLFEYEVFYFSISLSSIPSPPSYQPYSSAQANTALNDITTTLGDRCDKMVVADEETPSPLGIEYTLLNEMPVEFKQFVSLTSATSSGLAKVMSTHYLRESWVSVWFLGFWMDWGREEEGVGCVGSDLPGLLQSGLGEALDS